MDEAEEATRVRLGHCCPEAIFIAANKRPRKEKEKDGNADWQIRKVPLCRK